MATIYRFIVENKAGKGLGGLGGASKKSTAKTVTPLKLLTGGIGGGVNNNRSMRAINGFANKVIPGYEKGLRFTKGVLGLVKLKPKTGGGYQFAGLSASAIAVIVLLAINVALSHHKEQLQKVERENTANYKKLETGQSAVRGQYKVTTDWWTGKIDYNENK